MSDAAEVPALSAGARGVVLATGVNGGPPAGRRSLTQDASAAGASVVLAVGVAVLFGWALDITALKSVVPTFVSIKANTALAFVLLGFGLLFLRARAATRYRRALGLTVAAIGLITILEYVLRWDAGIDQLLFPDAGVVGTSHPGRMSPTAALSFLLTGVALASRNTSRTRGIRRADLLVLVAIVIAFLAFVGYLFGASALYAFAASTQMALVTSITLLIAGPTLLAIDPEHGIGWILLRPTAGGIVARRLIPLALLLPITVGVVGLAGERAGLYDSAFGLALMVVTLTTIFVAAAALVSWALDGAHVDQLSAEASSLTDELTGLANRRAAVQALRRFDLAASQSGRPYSVLAMDLDGLKGINDTGGHAAGDIAIRRVAAALRDTLRGADLAARMGGDEFVALLFETNANQAGIVGDRIRAAIAANVYATANTKGRAAVTASIGISVWSPGRTGQELLAEADRALYVQKAAPRVA